MKTSKINLKTLNVITEGSSLHEQIEHVLTTPMMDMIGNLDKGTRIQDYFHEPATVDTAAGLANECMLLLSLYMPYITVLQLQVELVEENGAGGAIILIEFEHNNEVIRDSFDI